MVAPGVSTFVVFVKLLSGCSDVTGAVSSGSGLVASSGVALVVLVRAGEWSAVVVVVLGPIGWWMATSISCRVVFVSSSVTMLPNGSGPVVAAEDG